MSYAVVNCHLLGNWNRAVSVCKEVRSVLFGDYLGPPPVLGYSDAEDAEYWVPCDSK